MEEKAEAQRPRSAFGIPLRGFCGKNEDADLAEARALHQSLLPPQIPQIPGIQVACAWQGAAAVSGDYYDVLPLSGNRLALCVADVSGKGMPAVRLTQAVHDAIHRFAPGAESPAALCISVNQALCGNIAPGSYVTLFYGVLDAAQRTLRYENAAHCLPLLVRADGSIEFPASFSGLIGIFSHWLYQTQELPLRSGDTLLLLTDGIIQAENTRHEPFGYQRLIEIVDQQRGQTASELSQSILAAVSAFCKEKLRDDLSLIVVKSTN